MKSRRAIRALMLAAVLLAIGAIGFVAWRQPSVQMLALSRMTFLRLEERVSQDPNDWRVQFWFGKRAAENGEVAKAEPALRAAAGTAPDYLPAFTELGKLLLAQGRVDESYQLLRSVVERDASQKDAQLALAQLYRMQGAFHRAIEILEQLLRQEPANVTARYEMAVNQVSIQRFEAAEEHLRTGLKTAPKDTRLLMALSRVRKERGDLAEAESLARASVKLMPDDPLALLNLAQVLAQKQPAEPSRVEALDLLGKARVLAPNHPGILQEAGELLLAAGRFPEAADALTTLTQLTPSNPQPHYLLSQALKRLGRVREGKQSAATFKRKQTYQQRVADLSARLGAHPDDAGIRFQIGELHAAEGELELAIRSFRNGLQRQPDNKGARARMAELVRADLKRSSDAGDP